MNPCECCKWVDIAGGGATHYVSADGLLGSQISMAGYPNGALGYNGSVLLRHFHEWNGTIEVNGFLKTFDKSSGQQTQFAGMSGPLNSSLDACTDGTNLSSCAIPYNYYQNLTKAQWDGTQWLVLQKGTTKIRTALTGGNWGTLVTLPRAAQSFHYVVKSTVPHVYYCSAGRMYRYNINTTTETALPWPTASLACTGVSIVWHPTRQSIVFPITQNSIGGVAEIYDP